MNDARFLQNPVPPFARFSTAPEHAEFFQTLIAETDDDPNLDLHRLSDGERANIALHFIVRSEVEIDAKQFPDLLAGVDYYLSGTPFDGVMADRRMYDIARNMGFGGMELFDQTQGKALLHDDRTADVAPFTDSDPDVNAFVQSSYYQSKVPKPVIRTLGFGQQDYLPHLGMTSAYLQEELLEPLTCAYRHNLFTTASRIEQVERLRSLFTLSGMELHAKNAQLRRDISMLLASAVRRHPETELQFGVMLDARYNTVARHFARSGLFRVLTHNHHPATSVEDRLFLPSARHKAEQYGYKASQATLERVLLNDYLYEAFLAKTGKPTPALRATRHVNHSLPDTSISYILREIDEAKEERLPLINILRESREERRKKIITELIWNLPEIVLLMHRPVN